MKSLLLSFLYALCTLPLFAQKRNTVHTKNNTASYITSFPFRQLAGGIIIVEGKIDNKSDTLNFIMDTGSSSASLDSATCVRLKLPFINSESYIRGVGVLKKIKFTNINTLVFPGIRVNNPRFHINDYEFLSEVYGIKIDGIIGYSFFKDYIVEFNFDSSKIRVFTPGKYNYEKPGELLYPSLKNRIPVIDAAIKNGVEINTHYYFDMGAGLCLLFSNRFAKDSSIFKRKRRRRKTVPTLAQGLNGKINMHLTTIKKVKIGHYSFRNIPTYTFDDVSNVTKYPYLGGLIGNDLLRRFNITLNYPSGEIYIHPNSHFNELFDYSYTGLTLYFINDHVEVGGVIKNSPADKAGILSGDIIIGINNDLSNNMQKYRKLLRNAGKKVTILLLRNGFLLRKILSIKSIL